MYAELQNELEACQEYTKELKLEEDAKLRDEDLEDDNQIYSSSRPFPNISEQVPSERIIPNSVVNQI